MATELPFKFFDCDNHYYEALGAFTRHLEPAYRKRAMQWAQIDGKTRLLVGGRVNKFIPNPTFNPVAAPGVMDEYFRGRNPKGADPRQDSPAVILFTSRPGAVVTARDVRAWCGAALAAFKVPVAVEFRDELPYSQTGKLLKQQLEREETGQHGS
jgi:hypothetical protein